MFMFDKPYENRNNGEKNMYKKVYVTFCTEWHNNSE